MSYEKVLQEAKNLFESAKGSHDWDHTMRVYNMCVHIGEVEGADMELLKLAAILHDVGRDHQDKSKGKVCHAEKGAEIAKEILEKYSYEKELIDKVVHCIKTHRFRNSYVPESMEAKILFDADKLDAIGAVGVGRSFLFAGEIGARLHNKDVDIEKTEAYSKEDTGYREFMVKLRYVKDKMLTNEGKNISKGRHEFMTSFFDRINTEVDGDL